MSKTKKLKTEVIKKDVSPAEVGTKTTKEALEKQEKNKDKLAVDPTITQEETKKSEEVNKAAMEAKLAAEAKVQERTNDMTSETPVDVKDLKRGKELKESKELKEAVKADAEKRGKKYTTCPVTGVLIAK